MKENTLGESKTASKSSGQDLEGSKRIEWE